MENMENVLNALVVFLKSPRKPVAALQELLYMTEKYGDEAMKEFEYWKQEYDALENENLQLRQMLKQAGIAYGTEGGAA